MLQNIAYCPILYTRVSEIKALFQLPVQSKDRIFPILSARPWPNAKQLSRTWEKITEAFGSRRFALDLDETKRFSDSAKPAAAEFAALFNQTNGFENYYGVVGDLPSAIPVLRMSAGTAPQFDEQAAHIDRLDKGLVVRFCHDGAVPPLALVDRILERFDDLTIFVDMGWSRDLVSREMWASQIIGRIADQAPETELVIAGSSFPDTFTNIAAKGSLALAERILHSSLVRRHNAVSLVYGDWGSTRPPSTEDIPMRNIPRIDLPASGEWIFFRRDKRLPIPEDYSDVAQRVVDDEDWPGDLKIWGTYTIECTADDLPGAIKSPGTAAAARINIHLHRQAFYGVNNPIGDADEPFSDD